MTRHPSIIVGDCLQELSRFPNDHFDLVFTSPPYEDARTYGMDFKLKGQDWVDWCIPRFEECLRVCKGLVAWVVQGRTRKFKWSCTPALLIADLHRKGICVRNPPIYHRSGIPGSGGPDWLRSDYEWIVCATGTQGRLPWSDNTACGDDPKFKPGGDPTHRKQDGKRVRIPFKRSADKSGASERCDNQDNVTIEYQSFKQPKIANPGNVIKTSGGHLGSKIAGDNEAPFPERLAEFFIKSFCPPNGRVLDPFAGSGTTCAVAEKNGRRWTAIDVRDSQKELIERRIREEVR